MSEPRHLTILYQALLSWYLEDPYQLHFQVTPVRWVLNTIRHMSSNGVINRSPSEINTPYQINPHWLGQVSVFLTNRAKHGSQNNHCSKQRQILPKLPEADKSIIRNRQHLHDLTPPNEAPTWTSTIPVDTPNSSSNTSLNRTPTATLCQPTATMVDRSTCTRNTKACCRPTRRWTIPLQQSIRMHDTQSTSIPRIRPQTMKWMTPDGYEHKIKIRDLWSYHYYAVWALQNTSGHTSINMEQVQSEYMKILHGNLNTCASFLHAILTD